MENKRTLFEGQNSEVPSPREFMKQRRPERFSDSQTVISPEWDPSRLSYHLETITHRSDENEFEEFARQLLKRVIAPNLSSQTGPMAGGDGKVDSDTYPVADELALNWLATDEMLGGASERWALAASTQKDWKSKVRSDIKKIVQTGRGYTKAFFVSSRHIPSKDKHALQDNLQKLHGIEVTILDREWIIDVVLGRRLESLFAKHLKYTDPSNTIQEILGPNDTSKLQRKAKNEERIAELEASQLLGPEAVRLAIENAILDRGLERNREEVLSAFARALRLAKKLPADYAVRDCHYHMAWTLAWWYEDWEAFVEHYEAYKQLIPEVPRYSDIERLHNLWTILYSQSKSGRISLDPAQLSTETSFVRSSLQALADQTDLPNASLSARSTLALMGALTNPEEATTAIQELRRCVQDAKGRIEFSMVNLAEIVTELEPVLGDHEKFEQLFDEVIEASSSRANKSEIATLKLRRCYGLAVRKRDQEALIVAGQAVELLKQGEDPELLSYALAALSECYESVGLLWAARATCLIAVSVALPAEWDPSCISAAQAKLLHRLKWLELKLGFTACAVECHLFEIAFARTAQADFCDQSEYQNDRVLFDAGVVIHILRQDSDSLTQLTHCPDFLDEIDLFFAAAAAKHVLGHPHELPEVMDSSVDWFDAILNQPMAGQISDAVTLGIPSSGEIRSVIAGCKVTVRYQGSKNAAALAKSFTGFLEAFLATCISSRIVPRAPNLDVQIFVDSKNENPSLSFEMDSLAVNPTLHITLSSDENGLSSSLAGSSLQLREAAFTAIANAFLIDDLEQQFEKVAVDDNGLSRSADALNSLVCDERLYGTASRSSLQLLSTENRKSFALNEVEAAAHAYKRTPSKQSQDSSDIPDLRMGEGPIPPEFEQSKLRHDEIAMPTLIRPHLWDAATWRATGFAGSECGTLRPILVIVFEDRSAAEILWAQLVDDVRAEGSSDVLRVSIIQGISKKNPCAYRVTVSPSERWLKKQGKKVAFMIGRANTMEPTNDTNLNRFLEHFRKHKSFELTAGWLDNNQPNSFGAESLEMSKLEVRQAYEIGINDLDAAYVHEDDDVIIPPEISNPPLHELMSFKKSRKLD